MSENEPRENISVLKRNTIYKRRILINRKIKFWVILQDDVTLKKLRKLFKIFSCLVLIQNDSTNLSEGLSDVVETFPYSKWENWKNFVDLHIFFRRNLNF